MKKREVKAALQALALGGGLGVTSAAHAQTWPVEADAGARAGAAPVVATPPAASAAPAPTIAPPAPGASPEKVAEAQDVARVAAKTPIVPNPRDPTRPAFQLYTEMDLPVLGSAWCSRPRASSRPSPRSARRCAIPPISTGSIG